MAKFSMAKGSTAKGSMPKGSMAKFSRVKGSSCIISNKAMRGRIKAFKSKSYILV